MDRLGITLDPEQREGALRVFSTVAHAAIALHNYDQRFQAGPETSRYVPWVDNLSKHGFSEYPARNGVVLFYKPDYEKSLPIMLRIGEFGRSLSPTFIEFLHGHTTPTTPEESVLRMRQIMNRNFANKIDDPISFFGLHQRRVRHLPPNSVEAVRWLLRGNLLIPSSSGLLHVAQPQDFALCNHIGGLSQLTRHPFVVSGFNFMETVNAFGKYVSVPNIIGKSGVAHAQREMKTRNIPSAYPEEVALYGRVLRELQDMQESPGI